ncbi:AarF/ABC1/UbiB kinase family protein [Bacillus luteolus]|uniref:AarF/ABC1/UbiB kinase family protein n=1 Tax=Litchfieldia luteola TaxID=682179 RepID=A0ABR9QG86_9BACI|nr:AarF/UbiB family protein [Cytobacillus luteolus]MBE4907507.1 AarF/ABC1/UbiB kinase family protein [Cytobacillus luteolus]MBP1944275.1 putative unusual protein kinase regulating ubiquinone biosynthesis (AarF/ABC1/UbiB family) [Cytobacillus luteolus]
MKKHSKLLRMYKILSMAFVIFIKIYWFKIRRKPESEWEKLWGDIGKRFKETLVDLEGLLIKIGQFLSIRGDLLPKSFISQIEDLVDKVPPSKWNDIEFILEEEWEGSIEGFFSSIHPEAIASASIGEVYQGVLLDGTKVAVKVQRPTIASIVKTDFRSLAIIFWFADHFVPVPRGFINFKVLFQELKHVIERELDYHKELETLLYFKSRFKEVEGVKIPEIYPELCTSRVLVMEWVEGRRVTDNKALNELQINRGNLAKRLLHVFLPQWLEPGIFHADPHPGNVLIDQNGNLILLDFGMIGEISKKDAATFQTLIEGIVVKDYAKVVNGLSNLGFLLPEADLKSMEKLLSEMLAIDFTKIKEMDMFAVKKEMNDIVHTLPIQVPTRFVFLGRSYVTIEGMLLSIAPDEELVDLFKPVLTDWLKTQGSNKWTFLWQWVQSQPLFKVLHSVGEFLDLPNRMENLKENEQRRQFRFTVFENYKKQLSYFGLAGVGGSFLGLAINHLPIIQISSGIMGVSFIGYLFVNTKQKKWMRFMQDRD